MSDLAVDCFLDRNQKGKVRVNDCGGVCLSTAGLSMYWISMEDFESFVRNLNHQVMKVKQKQEK